MTNATSPLTPLISVTHDLQETGELVVYDADGSTLLVLNPLGAYLWTLLDGKRSVVDLVDAAASAYPEIARSQLMSDIDAFITALSSHGVLTAREPSPTSRHG